MDPTPTPVTRLTEGVLAALDRPANPVLTLSTGRSVVTGVLTAGLWPAIELPRKWLDALRWQDAQGEHVADWAATNLGQVEAATAREAVGAPWSQWLARLALLLVGVAMAVAVVGIVRGVPAWRFWFSDPRTGPLVRAYLTLLGSSYLATWLSVNVGLRRLNGLARVVGDVTADLGRFVTKGKRWEWGVRPVPVVGGLVLGFLGLPWALPMLLATTAQRRALEVSGRRVRQRMGGRLREAVEQRRPAVESPSPVGRATPCVNAACSELLPHDARHCPRCGAVQRPTLAEKLR